MKYVFKISNLALLLALLLLFTECSDNNTPQPLDNDPNAPGVVTNVTVDNLPGKALVHYTLPKDQNLLYVKAEYNIASGRKMQVKSSYYSNSLLLEGFSDTIPQTINLYSVSRSEVASAPVPINVQPLKNPIWEVFNSLNIVPAFGGMKIAAQNSSEEDVAIIILVDSLGEWIPSGDAIYTSAQDIDKTVRGLDSTNQKFGFLVRDRFQNYSSMLVTEVKPLYETALPKSNYRAVSLPGDAQQIYSSTGIDKMWDGNYLYWPSCCLTDPAVLQPQHVTFDLGVTAKLSRIQVWNYPEWGGTRYYYEGAMRYFEIWGSDNPPSDGSWNNWHLLAKCEEKKPSGGGYDVQTPEDYDAARAGFSYDFDVTAPPCRYLRINCIQNWKGSTFMSVSEVQVYGAPQ